MSSISPLWTPYPVPTTFVLSYLQGYHHGRSVIPPDEKSHKWGLTWAEWCYIVTHRPVCAVSGPDAELVYQNWTYYFP